MMLRTIVKFNRVSLTRSISSFIDLSDEVKCALQEKRPVVALESTIITHGMPYPVNLKTARNVEKIVRHQGVVPATIAIIEGRIKVGLNDQQLELLSCPESKIVKTSRRDFSYVVSNKLNGGTTVAGTLIVSNAVGIRFFVTGGLGGVHRCAADTMDISADLIELGKSAVMVVCSGLKSILDIPKSLEFLETQGVSVVNYKCEYFPSFFSSSSKLKAPYTVDSALSAAQLMDAQLSLRLNSGIVLAVPVPEEFSIEESVIENCIEEAMKEAKKNHVSGKQLTPFLLSKVKSLTEGRSLESNVALIENNAKVGSEIALEFSKIESRIGNLRPLYRSDKRVFVIGGSVVDTVISVDDQIELDGRTVDGRIEDFAGGVGRNLADALGKLGPRVSLVSAVGRDNNAHLIRESVRHVDALLDVKRDHRTGSFVVLVDKKGDSLLYAGCNTIHSSINVNQIERNKSAIKQSSLVVFDANLPVETIEHVVLTANNMGIPCWFEPTDLIKCTRLIDTGLWEKASVISPNLQELRSLALRLGASFDGEFSDRVEDLLNQVLYLAEPISLKVPTVFVTLGIHGSLILTRGKPNESFAFPNDRNKSVSSRYYPATLVPRPVNSSGAGDCGAAGFIAGALKGLTEPECVALAHKASECALMSKSPVPSEFIVENTQPSRYSVL